MRKIALALLASFAFAHGAFAADAVPAGANAAAVRELLDAMNYRTMWQASIDQMAKALPGMIREQTAAALNADSAITDAQRKERLQQMEAELPKMADVLRGVLGDPGLVAEMETEMIALYSRHFTADELKQIAAYYRTPVGAKSMQVMPQLMAESMAISQRLTTPRIRKAMEQFRKDKE
ncbi:DUF2059 domain-containing protein [Pseudoduganella violaceinigra]|uniref:DUF2059 domain-containing protein n=1 Tax=Pseudoduganella violaceinigra TaxID=246602 RepID=UPI0004128BE8|nr:DUF2059 domain-containing protein [Pseudoduganella violaceinigra]